MSSRLVLALTGSALLVGCTAVVEEVDGLGITDDAVTQAATQCADAEPDGDRGETTITDARVRCLTDNVAPRFLKLEAERRVREANTRGDSETASIATSLPRTYTMRVDGGGCFDASINPWFAYAHDIGNDDLPELVKQLRNSAMFLGQLHTDLAGHPNILFDTLGHCPYEVRGSYLVSEGSTLYVGVNKDWGTVVPTTDVALRGEWASGNHLSKLPAKMKAMWPLLDPAGAPRTALRKVIRRDVLPFASSLRALTAPQTSAALTDGDLRSELMAAVDANTVEGLKVFSEQSADHQPGQGCTDGAACTDVRQVAKNALLGLDRRGLERFATRWATFAGNPENIEKISMAVVGAHHVVNQNEWNINRVQIGLVNVANLHDIEVDVRVLIGDAARFSRYLLADRPTQQTQRIRSFQIGLVNTDTIDWVNVKLHIGADRGLQSAGLEEALRVALQPSSH